MLNTFKFFFIHDVICFGRSSFFAPDLNGNWVRTIGMGIFASIDLHQGDIVTSFTGEFIDNETFAMRCAQGRGGYGIQLRKNEILDCYEAAKAGNCFGSMANSPHNVRVAVVDHKGNIVFKKPQANCTLVVCYRTRSVRLKISTKIVTRGVELCRSYSRGNTLH